jgi:hypothetical protein
MVAAVAAHAVDQDVQVDILMSKIINAQKEGRAADALPSMAKLESMEPTLKAPLSEGFHFLYITTLDESGDHANALRRANVYLEKFGKGGKNYAKVVDIIGRLEDIVAEEQVKREKDRWVSQGGLTWMPISFKKSWTAANSYCNNTIINGQRGWRLPTQGELLSLYNSGAMNDKGWELSGTWSSTPITSGEHFFVPLHGMGSFSVDYNYNVDTYELYVTCVR